MDKLETGEDVLKRIGLTDHETKVYLVLLKKGPQKALNIAKILGRNKVHIYRHLKDLENMGLVKVTLTSPAKFEAVPFKEALDFVINAKKDEAAVLEARKEKMAQLVYESAIPDKEDQENRIMVFKGINCSRTKTMELVKKTQKEFIFATANLDSYPYGIKELIEKMRVCLPENKAKCRAVTVKNPLNEKIVKALFNSKDFQARFIEGDFLPTFWISDEKDAMFSLCNMQKNRIFAEKKDVPIFWTNNPEIIAELKILFNYLWQDSKSSKTQLTA